MHNALHIHEVLYNQWLTKKQNTVKIYFVEGGITIDPKGPLSETPD